MSRKHPALLIFVCVYFHFTPSSTFVVTFSPMPSSFKSNVCIYDTSNLSTSFKIPVYHQFCFSLIGKSSCTLKLFTNYIKNLTIHICLLANNLHFLVHLSVHTNQFDSICMSLYRVLLAVVAWNTYQKAIKLGRTLLYL